MSIPQRRALIAAACTLTIVLLSLVAVLVIHAQSSPNARTPTRTTNGTPTGTVTLGQGADPGPVTSFALDGGGTVNLPTTWPHLPSPGGDIAMVAYAPTESAAAGSTVTIRVGSANPMQLSRTLAMFKALQASIHPGWQLLLQTKKRVPGMMAAELIVAQYDTARGTNTTEDLIAHDKTGRALHISVLGPTAVVGTQFLDSITLSLHSP